MIRSTILQGTGILRAAIRAVAGTITVCTTVVIASTLLTGVVVRYVLSGSLAWSAELPTILFPWLIMSGVVLAASQNQHLGVSFVVQRLPEALRRGVELVMVAGVGLLMVALAWQVPSLTEFMQYQTTPVLGWPATWAFYSIPAGTLAVALLSLIRLPEILLAGTDDESREATP